MIYYNEFEPFAVEWLKSLSSAGHIAPGVVDSRSIKEVSHGDVGGATQAHFFAGIGVWSHALRLAGWPDERPVWTGSCPCQPFSVAGRGKGVEDERHLWPEWFRLIRECRPPVVFGEQVASPDGLAWLDAVRADLEGAGYAFGAADLCAAGVGAPHIRQRLYFVGVRLADPNEGGQQQQRATRVHEEGPPWNDAARRGPPGGLAHYRSEGRGQVSEDPQGRSEGSRAQGVDERSLYGGALSSRGLGHADCEHAGRNAGASDRAEGGPRLWSGGDEPRPSGATSGFWAGPDWVACRDGKLRPVEPGTFPLAHGAPARVGRLRAYGNAIVSEVAATFIRAVMEATT